VSNIFTKIRPLVDATKAARERTGRPIGSVPAGAGRFKIVEVFPKDNGGSRVEELSGPLSMDEAVEFLEGLR
jgi:hypothetical protein